MDEWERRLIQDVRQALELTSKYATAGAIFLIHFKGKDYKGIKLKDWEQKDR